MLKNYFKIAVRNLWRHKVFTGINIIGMGVAFAATILLSLSSFYELSFDSFHHNKNEIYQLYFEEHRVNGVDYMSNVSIPLTPALRAEVPGMKWATRYGDFGGSVIRYKDKEFNYTIRCVDEDFLQMFDFPLVQGNKDQVLSGLNNVVITEKGAKNIFGTADVVGKMLEIKIGDEVKNFMITGVAKDVPKNTSLQFVLLARFENFPSYAYNKDQWQSMNHDAFIQLDKSVRPADMEQKLKGFVHKYFQSNIDQLKHDGAQPDAEGEYYRVRLLPLPEVHFSDKSNFGGLSKTFPVLLLVICGFILFIAAVNFVNLSLGRAITRIKEIGVRKVIGASRSQILVQFWGESLLICTIAFLLAIFAASALLPSFNALFNRPLTFGAILSPSVALFLMAGFAAISLIAGGYPALIVSKLNAALTVKGKIGVGKSNRLRNSLMVIQFAISALLIICTIVVGQQVHYLRNRPLGYNKDQVISIPIGNNIEGERALKLMRSQLAAVSGVLSVTGSDTNLGMGRDNSSTTSIMGFGYKDKNIKTHWQRVDFDYLKTLGLQLVAGRDFSPAYGADSTVVIINEKMAAELGEKNPLGVSLELDGSKLQVVGVVKDFNFKSLRSAIAPLTMCIRPDWTLRYLFVKVQPDNLPTSMAAVEKVWKEINPKAEAELSFLDENTDLQYRKEAQISTIVICGAVLAIMISCMGLFAIAVLMIAQRTKEIGIRKVLGASVTTLIALLSKDFLKLIGIAILIAAPLGWWLMNKWLEDFAYRIHLNGWMFMIAALVTIAITVLTVYFQALKAALTSPVKNLRTE